MVDWLLPKEGQRISGVRVIEWLSTKPWLGPMLV
jgi:hypothetical protein